MFYEFGVMLVGLSNLFCFNTMLGLDNWARVAQ